MEERVNELNDEIKRFKERKEVIQNFISEQKENTPCIVLGILQNEIRRLCAAIDINELSLRNYE